MVPPGDDPLPERAPRIPLYLRVRTEPELGDCWSINVSPGGMAVMTGGPHEAAREGAILTVEVALPDTGHLLRARARVVWTGARPTGSTHRVALGLSFLDLRPPDRAALVRYLSDYRPRALLLFASPEEEALCARTLEPDVKVAVCRDEAELDRQLAQGDVYVALVCGSDPRAALRAMERICPETQPLPPWSEGETPLPAPRVVWCARADPERLVELHNQGRLYQSMPRPMDPHLLAVAVRRACEDFAVRSELRRVHLELRRSYAGGGPPGARPRTGATVRDLVLSSPPMRAVLELVAVVAPHKAHVLLQGETGTGKELLANAIHQLSDRSDGPFVAMDCGALTETLLESELFGHVEGAFTGARSDRPGLFQLAEGGTLFLDEIENTTPGLQVKLLRVLDKGEVRPVGGSKVRRVDVRLVAASNRELRAEVDLGRFRSDLYYRLSAFPIDVPPLRERREDILPLVRHYLAHFGAQIGRTPGALTPDAAAALEGYGWPGNVRELRNCVERAVLLCGPGQPLDLALLPGVVQAASRPEARPEGSLQLQLQGLERRLIREALGRNGNVLRRAARELGTHPVTLARRARQLGIRVP